jgi:hypothetical protein
MIARLRAAKRPDNKPASPKKCANGQTGGLAVAENKSSGEVARYFAATGSGTGVSDSVCR